jgi:hypothetical protein
MKTVFSTALLAAFAVAFLAPGKVLAQATNVTGEWAFSVTTDQGAGEPTMTFKQDGEKLTGKYNGQFGTADLTGTVKGNAIQFTFTIDVQGQQAPATYKGTVEKDAMKGTMDIGGMVSGTFTATKK